MTRFRLLYVGLVGAGLGLTLLPHAPLGIAVAQAQDEDKLRPEVGKPLQKAQDFVKQHKFSEASAQLRDAEAAKNKTAYESFVIEQMRGAIAQASGDTAGASKSFQAQLASGRVTGAEQTKLVLAVASMSYQAKDYPTAITWFTRYFKEPGADPANRTFLIQSYYLSGDYANAGKAQAEQIAAEEKANAKPSEEQLQLLAACQTQTKDNAGFAATMEKLVVYYPKKDYWAQLIHGLQVKPGFSDRLTLDLDRLQLAVGTLAASAQYMDMAQIALQAGLTGEAKTIVDKGYTAGVLGTGTEAPRQQRLKDLVTRTIADDQQNMGKGDAEAAAAKDGNALFDIGAKYVSYGQFDKGIPAMEQGIRKDALKHPEDAKLHLGLAYLAAGQKAKAVQMLKTVGGTDGTADLARLWILQIGKV
ncbi:hypothetical protein GCM10011611_11900 [Aliidongia dinghuensis]|uniref:Tetratricopeptide repeat protein n=1 Tax=Aliidongia dinghuensis TaxID=1867774 RepID=A0A8J2YR28_9PROT|nr:hypothetical protein [Aliidongia dinghuensis]GGF08099.1 hypothetical protein GCM10011611_11900 [Aliidongia dinghuensis]